MFGRAKGALHGRLVAVPAPRHPLARAVLALAALSLAVPLLAGSDGARLLVEPRARGRAAAGFAASGRPPRGRLGDGRRLGSRFQRAPRRRRAHGFGRRGADDVRALAAHRRGGGRRGLLPRHGDRVRRRCRAGGDAAAPSRPGTASRTRARRCDRVVRERARGPRAGLHPRAPPGRRAPSPHRHRGALRQTRARSLSGRTIDLARPGSGPTALPSASLRAFDATGRRLPARLALAAGRRILLRVDDRGARYPLTIDPTIQQGGKLTPSDGRPAAASSASASRSPQSDGNTALVGAPGENGGLGAAWIYTRSGSTWRQAASSRRPSTSRRSGTRTSASASRSLPTARSRWSAAPTTTATRARCGRSRTCRVSGSRSRSSRLRPTRAGVAAVRLQRLALGHRSGRADRRSGQHNAAGLADAGAAWVFDVPRLAGTARQESADARPVRTAETGAGSSVERRARRRLRAHPAVIAVRDHATARHRRQLGLGEAWIFDAAADGWASSRAGCSRTTRPARPATSAGASRSPTTARRC